MSTLTPEAKRAIDLIATTLETMMEQRDVLVGEEEMIYVGDVNFRFGVIGTEEQRDKMEPATYIVLYGQVMVTGEPGKGSQGHINEFVTWLDKN